MLLTKILKIGLYVVGIVFVLTAGVLGWAYQYRQQLFRYIVKQVNQNVNGTFTADNFHFTPFTNGLGLSFTLFNVHLRDRAYSRHHTELLTLRQLTIKIDARELLNRKVQINSVSFEKGKINIFVEKSGYSNLSIFDLQNSARLAQNKQASSFVEDFLGRLERVHFERVDFSLQDSLKEKRFDFFLQKMTNDLQSTDTSVNLHLKGKVKFGGLAFDIHRGAFLENKPAELELRMSLNTKNFHLLVEPSRVRVNKDNFGLKGGFDFSNQGRVQLEINTDTIATPRALEIVPKRLARRIAEHKILPVVTAKVKLDGPLRGGVQPRVEIDFQTKTFKYETPFGPLVQTLGKGNFSNQVDMSKPVGDQNSRITAQEVSGLLYGVIPTNLAFTITDLEEPLMVMEGNLDADLRRCKQLLEGNDLQLQSGRAMISYCYEGKIDPVFDEKNNQLNGKIEGNVSLSNAAFMYVPERIRFNRINSFVRFTEKKVQIPFLFLNHQHNQIRVKGDITGLLPYAFNSSDKVAGNISIYTPNLGLDWVRDYHTSTKREKPKRGTELMDKLLRRLELKMLLVADNVHYRRFQAQKVKGNVSLTKQAVKCENVKMRAFGGDFQVTGGIEQFDQPIHRLYAQGQVNNADVQKIFYAFENFGQTTISDHNLSGKISTTFSYSSQLKRDFRLLPNTMNGQLTFELSNGQLNHFEPLRRIQRVFFKRRNFNNVRFGNLTNRFVLQGQELNMEQMKVTSNVLTFFVGGTYSFRDKTDLLVQIPLSNLKRNPNEKEVQSLEGNNLLIRAVDEKGEIKLKYDMDWRKKTNR